MADKAPLPPDAAAIVALARRVEELCAAGAYAEAAAPAEELAERVRRTPDGEAQPDFVRALLWQAVIHEGLGDLDRTEALLCRAVDIAEGLRPSTMRLQAEALAERGAFYDRRDRYGEATALFERALALLGPSTDPDDPDRSYVASLRHHVLDSLAARAADAEVAGRYEEAQALLQGRRRLAVSRFGETSIEHATSLRILGRLAGTMGSNDVEVAVLKRALEIAEAAVAVPDSRVAKIHSSLADAQVQTGAYADAESHFLRALELLGGSSGSGDEERAGVLWGLSLLYLQLSRFDRALPLVEEYLAIARHGRASRPIQYALAAYNAGTVYHQLRRFADAERLLVEAVDIARAEPDKTDLTYVTSLTILIRHYYETGQIGRVVPLWKEAVEFINANVAEKHPAIHGLLMTQNVRLLLDAGSFAKAEPYLRQQLQLLAVGGAARRALVLDHLGQVCAATDRAVEALQAFTEAALIDDTLADEVFAISSEAERLQHVETLRVRYERFLSLVVTRLAASAEGRRAAVDLVLRRKAIVAEAMAVQREVILGSKHPELSEGLARIAAFREEAARLAFKPGGSARDAERRREVQALREELERGLARVVPTLELGPPPRDVDAPAIAAALPPEAALLEFARYRRYVFGAAPLRGEAAWGEARYLAVVIVAGRPDDVHLIDLGEAEAIDRLIGEYRSAVSGPASPSPDGTPGSRLRALVFDPLLIALGSRRRLFVAPDGDLSRLPFETLPDLRGRPLLEEHRISYLSAGRDLVSRRAKGSSPAGDPIVVASPDFDLGDRMSGPAPETQRSRDLRGQRLAFSPLPGTRAEGRSVAALLHVRPWMAKDALEGRLKACRSPRILHLATHGAFLGDDSRAAGYAGTTLENPLLRSFLALAGANTWLSGGSPPPEAEDGLLTAEDVSGLDLVDTEMVMLSACETGLGEVRAGEGVFGLRRAFMLAGAKTLVMSLWKVPDQQTCELMEDFYRRLLDGFPRAEALRAAQLAIRGRYPEVRCWGAFICQGESGPLPKNG